MINIFKKNLPVKIFIVFISFFLWIYVMGTTDPIVDREITISDYDVEFKKMSDDTSRYVVIGELEPIKIKLRGQTGNVTELLNRGIEPKCTVLFPKVGENDVIFDFKIPKNVEYTVTPLKTTVQLDKVKVESKPIEVVFTGTLPKNKEIKTVEISPAFTYVEGAESRIDEINKVECIIPLDERSEDFTLKTKVTATDKTGKEIKGLKLNNQEVFADIKLNTFKSVPVILNLVDELGEETMHEGYKVEPEKVKIIGDSSKIEKIQSLKTVPVKIDEINDLADQNIDILNPESAVTVSLNSVKIIKDKDAFEQVKLSKSKDDIIFRNFDDAEINAVKKTLPDEISVIFSVTKAHAPELTEDTFDITADKTEYDAVNGVPLKIETDIPLDGYILSVKKIVLPAE